MGLLRIYCSADDELLYQSHRSLEKAPIQELKSGDRATVEFVLMQRNIDGGFRSPWARVLAASYSLRIGLFLDSDRTQLAYQNTFTSQDEFTKAGTLALDTAAAEAAVVATPFQAACSLEIEVTDASGNDRTVYREALTLKKWLISGGASQQPGERYVTFNEAKALYVPRNGTDPNNPCDHFFMKSQTTGAKFIVYIDDQGRLVADAFAG